MSKYSYENLLMLISHKEYVNENQTEMLLNTHWNYLKRLIIPNVGKDVEKLSLLYSSSGSVNWYSHWEVWRSNTEPTLILHPSNSIPKYFTYTTVMYTHAHKKTCSRIFIILTRSKWKITQICMNTSIKKYIVIIPIL